MRKSNILCTVKTHSIKQIAKNENTIKMNTHNKKVHKKRKRNGKTK